MCVPWWKAVTGGIDLNSLVSQSVRKIYIGLLGLGLLGLCLDLGLVGPGLDLGFAGLGLINITASQ